MTTRVGVEMPIAEHPLHRSGRADFPHPAPTSGDDAKSLERIGMTGSGRRQPSRDVARHPCPGQAMTASATPKRAQPQPSDLGAERVRSVITDVASDHASEPCTLFGERQVHAPHQLRFHGAKLRLQALADRLPEYRITSVAPLPRTDVREAEKVERLRFPLTASLAPLSRKRTELDEPRLLGMKLQFELAHALGKIALELLGIRFRLKAQDDVVREPDNDDVAGRLTVLNTRPVRSPVDASTPPSRAPPHDPGPAWSASPSPYETFIHTTMPV